jgi:hypothetical protein
VAQAQTRDLSVSFESSNYRGRFIRHKNFHAELEPVSTASSDLDRHDATFIFTSAGLALRGEHYASWEASNPNLKDHFLRHQNFRLVLQKRPPPGDPARELFDNDATFLIVRGLVPFHRDYDGLF